MSNAAAVERKMELLERKHEREMLAMKKRLQEVQLRQVFADMDDIDGAQERIIMLMMEEEAKREAAL